MLRFEGHQHGYRGNLLGGLIFSARTRTARWRRGTRSMVLPGPACGRRFTATRSPEHNGMSSSSDSSASWRSSAGRLSRQFETSSVTLEISVDGQRQSRHHCAGAGSCYTRPFVRWHGSRRSRHRISRPMAAVAVNSICWWRVGIWKDIRNHVAHEGTWSNPGTRSHVRPSGGCSESLRGFDGSIHAGVDATRRALKHAVEGALQLRLARALASLTSFRRDESDHHRLAACAGARNGAIDLRRKGHG